jgi:hypothetical protein
MHWTNRLPIGRPSPVLDVIDNESKKIINMIVSPKSMSIMEAYELYRKNKLLINRRYQRKLVWTQPEKQNLIISILKKYPIPLILLASMDNDDYEIIDGMQRLNAIFGFIENEFSVNFEGKDLFFNTDDYTFAKSQITNGIFSPTSADNEFLSQEQVSGLISYPFPVTIFKTASDDEINETFRRINSNGKHLSAQEVRQAGNTTQFADLVREIASEVRGDASKTTLLLSQMPSISIDNRVTQGYGIVATETIWCKHGLLRVTDLRESEDEQVIADIILSIAFDEPFPASKEEFDNYYGTGKSDKSNEIDIKINALGKDSLKKDILLVFSEIANFCDTHLGNNSLKQIVNPDAGGNPIKQDFYAIFMAFYELMIKQNKEPFDNVNIARSFNRIHERLTRSRTYQTTQDRRTNINVVKGVIEPHFKDADATFRSSTSRTLDFHNYLMRSKVEAATYDYKQGLYTLDPLNREFSEDTFERKILRNIAAMANLGKFKKGFLFIGVTDKESDTLQVEKLDKLQNSPRYYGFGIVGLEREAIIKGVSLDQYIAFIMDKISQSTLPRDLKARVSKSATPITYHGNTLLMLEIEAGNEPVYFNDKLYERDGSNCKEVTGADVAKIFNLFR